MIRYFESDYSKFSKERGFNTREEKEKYAILHFIDLKCTLFTADFSDNIENILRKDNVIVVFDSHKRSENEICDIFYKVNPKIWKRVIRFLRNTVFFTYDFKGDLKKPDDVLELFRSIYFYNGEDALNGFLDVNPGDPEKAELFLEYRDMFKRILKSKERRRMIFVSDFENNVKDETSNVPDEKIKEPENGIQV